jgi:hypothetical protein
MLRRLFFFATLAMAAPSLSAAQTRTAPAPASPRGDTLSVALAPYDSVAVEQVEMVVRARNREVQFCFEESGLKTDPELSGVFAMLITLDTLGTVSRVDATHREWSGPDGAAVEECVMQRARTWKFPAQPPVAPARHEVTFRFSR